MVYVLSVVGVLNAIVAAAVPAAAGTAPPVPETRIPHDRGVGMAVSPSRLTIAASQTSKIQRLEIENRGSVPLALHTRMESMTQRANGSTLLAQNAPYSATNWVTVLPDHVRIGQGTRRYVRIRIRVPPNAEPGDHSVAIVFMTPSIPGKSNIHVAAGIGVPALITVPGPVIDDVSLTRLKAPGFSAGGPIPLAATVRESGDVHHSFVGAGNRLVAMAAGARVVFPDNVVLRDSTITMATKWTQPPLICVCHVSAAVVTDGRRSVAAATVVIFPVVQALIGRGVLVALVLAFLLFRRHQRRQLSAAYEAGLEDGVPNDGAPPA